ncbi:hypothetical protein [Taibaiella chishuiensis]|uniref:Uncharacterized protein n=1 Tax=Taibaiella chishuiensis TaxID=1434707 RepID=A0A2P8DDI6_9BACT|nr:hypothetical protein [Taibaiella chishuiensis]PSK95255.1 hypothetical protein B0I18_1011421 [Taibaiella chishuiensis]
MPANKKHLTASPWQRLLKITAAIVGGYFVTSSFLLFLMYCCNKKDVLVTMKFMAYLIWVALMIIAFLAKSGWKIWGWYLLIGTLFFAPSIYGMIFK